LRAAGETETTPENIQDWLGLDEGALDFSLMSFHSYLNKGSTVTFFIYFQHHYLYY
jgi:hypothetical protein